MWLRDRKEEVVDWFEGCIDCLGHLFGHLFIMLFAGSMGILLAFMLNAALDLCFDHGHFSALNEFEMLRGFFRFPEVLNNESENGSSKKNRKKSRSKGFL